MKAFPQNEATMYIDVPLETQQGMDLRDYFAAKAMQAIIGKADQRSTTVEEVDLWVGHYAYTVADAMIEARNESN